MLMDAAAQTSPSHPSLLDHTLQLQALVGRPSWSISILSAGRGGRLSSLHHLEWKAGHCDSSVGIVPTERRAEYGLAKEMANVPYRTALVLKNLSFSCSFRKSYERFLRKIIRYSKNKTIFILLTLKICLITQSHWRRQFAH